MAREIEGEMWTTEDHQAKGARELDPQVQEMVAVLKSLKEQVERTWEVLMCFDSEAAAQVSGAAETVDYFR